MKRLKRIAALATLCALAIALVAVSVSGASGGTATKAASKSPYVIGNITTLTGTFASSNKQGATGVKAWAKYVNSRGGINGHPIKLSVKDDKNDPAVALSLVKEFAADKNVIALVGNVSALEPVWEPVASQAKLPVVGDFPFTPSSTSLKYVFPPGTTQEATLYGQVYAATKLAKAKKIAFFYCAEVPACSASTPIIKKFARNLGASVELAQGVPATAPNYDAVCTAAKEAGVQTVVVSLGVSTIISLADSCASVGYKPKFAAQTTAIAPSLAKVPSLSNSIYGSIQTAPWFAKTTPTQKTFQAALKAAKVKSGELSAALSLGYTGGLLFETAVKTIRLTATRALVANAVGRLKAKSTLGGMAPPLTFKRNAPTPPVKCSFIVKATNGVFASVGGPTKTYCQP